MSITLSKAETRLLLEAASRGGALQIPESMKPVTRERMLGHFEAERLIEARRLIEAGPDGTAPRLTAAGYRAVGLRPPRKPAGEGSAAGTKVSLVRTLLGRPEGATLDELVGATGWLPHTTRAALSRIRSAGDPLAKTPRPDGKNAYRIETAPPKPAQKARTRTEPVIPLAA